MTLSLPVAIPFVCQINNTFQPLCVCACVRACCVQVTVVHVNAIAKNAADDKLRQSMRRFATTYPSPPATVVLISGDVNFSMVLNDLIHIHNFTVVLVHNLQASDALKTFATRLVNYETFIQDVGPPTYQQVCECVCDSGVGVGGGGGL